MIPLYYWQCRNEHCSNFRPQGTDNPFQYGVRIHGDTLGKCSLCEDQIILVVLESYDLPNSIDHGILQVLLDAHNQGVHVEIEQLEDSSVRILTQTVKSWVATVIYGGTRKSFLLEYRINRTLEIIEHWNI